MDAAHQELLAGEVIYKPRVGIPCISEFVEIANQQPLALGAQPSQVFVADLSLRVLTLVVVQLNHPPLHEGLKWCVEVVAAVVVDQLDTCGAFGEVVLHPLSQGVAFVFE